MSSNSSNSSSVGSSPYQWTPEGVPSEPNSSGNVSLFAWIVVALLFPVALLNYLDRQMLAAMKASMVSSIPSIQDKEQWGLVLASFKWVYAGLSPFGGYVADRFSPAG